MAANYFSLLLTSLIEVGSPSLELSPDMSNLSLLSVTDISIQRDFIPPRPQEFIEFLMLQLMRFKSEYMAFRRGNGGSFE
jgi:hypothetical protein